MNGSVGGNGAVGTAGTTAAPTNVGFYVPAAQAGTGANGTGGGGGGGGESGRGQAGDGDDHEQPDGHDDPPVAYAELGEAVEATCHSLTVPGLLAFFSLDGADLADPALVAPALEILERDWPTLGPKLRGKLKIYVGDMDNYYLNNAVYGVEKFLRAANPPSGGPNWPPPSPSMSGPPWR